MPNRSALPLIGLFALVTGGQAASRASDYLSPGDLAPAAMSCPSPGGDGPGTNRPVVTSVEADWFFTQWQAAGEPSLYQLSKQQDGPRRVVRFTWLRSFHGAIFIRVTEQRDGTWLLSARELTGTGGGRRPGLSAQRLDRPLTTAESAALSTVLNGGPLNGMAGAECAHGLDGAEWMFETVENGAYKFVTRQSPDSGPVHDLGLTFVGLTGWYIEPVY